MPSKKAREHRGTAPPVSAPVAAAVRVSSTWIISPLWDSVLFIGAPLVCIATLLPLSRLWTSEQTAVFLLAFFTFGHHFPGFVRTYGDRELFARYRLRFLLAPPLIFATALWFDLKDLHGLVIFVSAWDIWHVLMQHYGFMRIYDAKQGVMSSVVSRMDWAVSISWYLTLIIASPHYRHNLLSRAYAAGLPLISASTFVTVQNLMMILHRHFDSGLRRLSSSPVAHGSTGQLPQTHFAGDLSERHLLSLCLCGRLCRWILCLVGLSLHSILWNRMGL